jgi:hypothetical protein
MQQALYRRLAVAIMGIPFLLNGYQIVTHAQNGGAGIGIIKAL